MMRKQLYIDEDLDRALKSIANRTGKPEAEHVRAALRSYLPTQSSPTAAADDPLLDLIALVKDPAGPTDVAIHHDDYLYGAKPAA
ncbi:MAG: ribbon-helix-helix domain-containing protein [Mycobacteriales bacterium]